MAVAYLTALTLGGLKTYINAPNMRLMMPVLLILVPLVWQAVRRMRGR